MGVCLSTVSTQTDQITTLRWLLAFAANNSAGIRQADIETAYLYGNIDVELYMKLPKGIRVKYNQHFNNPCVELKRYLYGLQQAGRMWYFQDQ